MPERIANSVRVSFSLRRTVPEVTLFGVTGDDPRRTFSANDPDGGVEREETDDGMRSMGAVDPVA